MSILLIFDSFVRYNFEFENRDLWLHSENKIQVERDGQFYCEFQIVEDVTNNDKWSLMELATNIFS